MPQGQVDQLMSLWAASLRSANKNTSPPFANHQDLLDTIDSTQDGNVPWDSFTISYSGPLPDDEEPPAWMLQKHEVCFRSPKEIVKNMLSNRDFDGEFDYVPRRDYDENGDRKYTDLFTGDRIWLHAVCNPLFSLSIYFTNFLFQGSYSCR